MLHPTTATTSKKLHRAATTSTRTTTSTSKLRRSCAAFHSPCRSTAGTCICTHTNPCQMHCGTGAKCSACIAGQPTHTHTQHGETTCTSSNTGMLPRRVLLQEHKRLLRHPTPPPNKCLAQQPRESEQWLILHRNMLQGEALAPPPNTDAAVSARAAAGATAADTHDLAIGQGISRRTRAVCVQPAIQQ